MSESLQVVGFELGKSSNSFYYAVGFSGDVMRSLDMVTIGGINRLIEIMTLKQCKDAIAFFSNREGQGGVNFGSRISKSSSEYFLVELSADHYCDLKSLVLSKLLDENGADYSRMLDDMDGGMDDEMKISDGHVDLHCLCGDCDNVQSLGIDEQRHHFDTFEHHGDNIFTCTLCGSKEVEVDVSYLNGGTEIEL